ncbi:MAG TPA: hypothetical protein VF616_05770 [Duganella sp.]|uniref:hypothetical protein n=1 Tax=Duganella sp. TaxID=1904440 RepID=UPI002ED0DA74
MSGMTRAGVPARIFLMSSEALPWKASARKTDSSVETYAGKGSARRASLGSLAAGFFADDGIADPI